MSLEIWTSRISTKDPDAFDVTYKSGAKVFAPSWAIFKPMLDIRRSGRVATEEEWQNYARKYLLEMRASRKRHPEAWVTLLGRSRAVLVCYCVDPARCHRTLLGRFLEKLGAVFHGELEPREDRSYQEGLTRLAQELDEV